MQLQPDTILFVYCLMGHLSREPDSVEEFLGTWEEEDYSYLFFSSEADLVVADLVHDQELLIVDRHTIAYGQWQAEHREPVEAAGLLFVPHWAREEPTDAERVVYLDTGLVFGDGLHPTTRACLEVMQRLFATHQINTMLDLGTGTGILALAAVKFGCPRVAAVDNNILAARTTRRNVVLNGFDEKILTICGRADEPVASHGDLLVANVQPEVIHRILETSLFRYSKHFIFSGMLHHEAERVVEKLEAASGVITEHFDSASGWQTIWGAVEQRP